MLGIWFARWGTRIARAAGHPWVFLAAVLSVVVWALTGPFTGYSEMWQLTINTGTTIVTFLMVFLIQNTQNRDTAALHLKLDEIIRANKDARNAILCIEDLTLEELDELRERYAEAAQRALKEDRANQAPPDGRARKQS